MDQTPVGTLGPQNAPRYNFKTGTMERAGTGRQVQFAQPQAPAPAVTSLFSLFASATKPTTSTLPAAPAPATVCLSAQTPASPKRKK